MIVAERCKREGINNLWMIHDSLGAHCCYSTRFSRIIRESFVEMFSKDVLQDMYTNFCEQLGDDSFLLQSPEKFGIKYGKYDLDEILKSEFAFK
jgi:DNA-directed RNA polymerase